MYFEKKKMNGMECNQFWKKKAIIEKKIEKNSKK